MSQTAETVYAPSLISRSRRTPEQMAMVRRAICEVLEETHPMTLRGLFYQIVGKVVIGKTEREYKNLGRILCKLRKDGIVPWEYVVDNTRGMRVPTTFHSVGHALRTIRHIYRRDPWEDQELAVYLMVEKDAIASVLAEETEPYCVPLAVVRGFSSQTFLHDIAMRIVESEKPAWIFYFGDHDPSGLSISKVAEGLIREFAPDAEIHFVRLAVTVAQIDEYDLPTRPTKKSNLRAKNFEGESVEVDALPMATLRALVREAIESCLDGDRYAITIERERAERQELADMVERYDQDESESEDDDDEE